MLHIQHTWPLSSLQLYWPQSCMVCTRADYCLQDTKFMITPGGADPGTSAGGEGQVYEGREVWTTYMEVGAGGGGENTFQLKENEAYMPRM